MPKPPIKIAAAAIQVTSDMRMNRERIFEAMTLASAAGARLVHFTEGALSGYAKAHIKSWDTVDWPVLAHELSNVQAAAHQLGVYVVLGCNYLSSGNARPYNSLHIISDQGAIVARYDKRLLSHTELTDWYAPGQGPCVFEVDGWRLGCALCIEIHFAELFAEYERLDADCVLLSTYGDDAMHWIQAQGHAAGNNLWISVATPAQDSKGLPGGLIGPDGWPLVRVAEGAMVSVATLDRTDPRFDIALNKARPWRRLARSRIHHARTWRKSR